jgi:hypothetical protein
METNIETHIETNMETNVETNMETSVETKLETKLETNVRKVELVYFGDNCLPGIIINDILGIRTRDLFQLAIYPFNSILNYLKIDNLHEIYDINFLCSRDEQDLTEHPSISENKFCHNFFIKHKKYDFWFNHNYDVSDLYILNYKYNVQSFKEKINHFQKTLADKNNFVYFINFTLSNDVPVPKIDEMIEFLLSKRDNFKIIFFTNSSEIADKMNEFKQKNDKLKKYYHVIHLNISYDKWYLVESKDRFDLLKETYEKFLETDDQIKANFPTFEQTHFYKNLQR